MGTAAGHPFYVYGRGRTPPAEIHPADWIRTGDGWAEASKVEDTGRSGTVYSLKGADYHTSVVGSREWGFGVWAHNMYPPGVEDQLRQGIGAAVNDHDARNFIVRTGKRADVPEGLGDAWAKSWSQAELQQLACMSQAARQDYIAARVRASLDDPAVMAARVNQAAAQTGNADLQLQARVAQAVGADLVRFNSDILTRSQSQFAGKVKYIPLTDIDVGTTKAIIEVTTQADAGGKVGQLQVLLGAGANPQGKSVLHFMPNATPGAAAALTSNGSRGVCRDLPTLMAALQALP
jgi:hypothetical protein